MAMSMTCCRDKEVPVASSLDAGAGMIKHAMAIKASVQSAFRLIFIGL